MEKEVSQDFIEKTVLYTVEIGKNLKKLLTTGEKSKKSLKNTYKNLIKLLKKPSKILCGTQKNPKKFLTDPPPSRFRKVSTDPP